MTMYNNVYYSLLLILLLLLLNSFLILLKYKYRFYLITERYHNIPGVPEIYYMRNIGLHCMALAMEMLGPSLDELLHRCGNKFSLKTVLLIALQTV